MDWDLGRLDADLCIECANSKQCAPHKHHYDECAERVMKQEEESEDGKAKEDCVEECTFIHSLSRVMK